jgi:GntR family transcriptional regulator
MKLSIDPHSPVPIYAQIVEQIKSLIMTGKLVSAANLPSVRSLASELEINSLTIQKAYKILQADGVVDIKKGVGAFVSKQLVVFTDKEKLEKASELLKPVLNKIKNLINSNEQIIELVKNELGAKDD